MLNCNIDEINPYILDCGLMNEAGCPPPGTVFEERTVKWYEIELILWGEGYITTEGKKIYTNKGNIFFRKPGMVVRGVSPYHCYIIVFDMFFNKSGYSFYSNPNIMNARNDSSEAGIPGKSFDSPASFDFPPVIITHQYGEFLKLFSGAYNEYICNRKESRFFLKTYLMQILSLFYTECASASRLHHSSRSIRLNYPVIMDVKKYMDDNTDLRFTLAGLSDIAGLSPNFFCRIFKDITGFSPIDYINRNKVNMAKKTLVESKKGIKEVAYECGFENDTYFYTLFKKLEGLTPSEFRQKQRIMFILSREANKSSS